MCLFEAPKSNLNFNLLRVLSLDKFSTMKKVLVFGGSNSKKSINKQLAVYTSSLLADAEVNIVDLNDFPLPIYGIDHELENGIPNKVKEFDSLIQEADGIIVSLAEHNGSYAAVFKNLLDWLSRNEAKNFHDKPMMVMATSPGGRGGISVLEAALSRFPRHGAGAITSFSLPSFQDNFQKGALSGEILSQLKSKVAEFEGTLN